VDTEPEVDTEPDGLNSAVEEKQGNTFDLM